MTVLITGIRGGVGRRVAAELRSRGEDVRGASSGGEPPDGLDVPTVTLDLSAPVDLEAILDGVDRVFLYAARGGVEELTDAFVRAGVSRVVVLSSAAVETDRDSMIGAHHAGVEQTVAASGLPWVFLRPNAFATNTLQWAEGVRAGEVALPFPGAFVEPIHEADIADAAVAALTDSRHESHAYYLSGPASMTQGDQVAVIAEVLGRPVRVTRQPVDDWRAELLAQGMPPAFADTLAALWGRAEQQPGATGQTVTAVTGAAPRTYADWVADHRADFA